MPVERFKSKAAYRKNLAYRHLHGIPFRAVTVVVAGKPHRVKHSGRAVDSPLPKGAALTPKGKQRVARRRKERKR